MRGVDDDDAESGVSSVRVRASSLTSKSPCDKKEKRFPRLAEIRAADMLERKCSRTAGRVSHDVNCDEPNNHSPQISPSMASPYPDSDGPEGAYFSEPDFSSTCNRRLLFHATRDARHRSFPPDKSLAAVFRDTMNPGHLVPSGRSRRRRKSQKGSIRRMDSGKLLRLGSEVSMKALSLANLANLVAAVSSSQSPNFRRHVVAAGKLEKQFPYKFNSSKDNCVKLEDLAENENECDEKPANRKKKKQSISSLLLRWYVTLFPNGIVASDPRAARVVAWEIVLILSLSALIVFVPVELAYVNYEPKNAWRPESKFANVLFIVARLFDAIFFLDVLINFFTGFYHEHTRAYITSLSDVVPKYLGSWFVVDVLSLVPFELLMRHGRVLRLVKLAKLKSLAGHVRVTRLCRVDMHMVELVQHVYLACAVIHVVCCGWSFVLLYQENSAHLPFALRDMKDAYELGFDENTNEPTSWVAANDVRGGPFEFYVAALQLLFQGEMTCSTLMERCLLVVSMAILYGLLIFILTEVMVLLGEITSMSGRYRTLARDMNTMMRDHGFPAPLRHRMRSYLRFRHMQTAVAAGGLVNAPVETGVLQMLSPTLRDEAVLAMNKANVASVPLFRQCGVPPDAILELSVNAVVQVYAGHEFIFRTGEHAVFVNCISKGLVMAKGQLLRCGGTFGKEAVLELKGRYTGSAFTLANTTVVHLSSHSFYSMFKKYPGVEATVRKVVSQRMARDALMAYARYMRAIDAGRGEQFRKNIFNIGFSRTMFARMFLTRSNSIHEFLTMERLVVQMQRAWRQRVAQRRRHEEKLRARAERAGITPVVDRRNEHNGFRFLDFGDVALLTKKETTEQRLDFIDSNQRVVIDSLRVLTMKLDRVMATNKNAGVQELRHANPEPSAAMKRTGGGVLLT